MQLNHCTLFFLSFFKKCFIILFVFIFGCVAVHGLSSSCHKWELQFVVVHGLLIVVASLCVEHGL